ncbi:MAG: 23S rRNA (adenine(2503)-C(2))-methyltransferase RlmN [Phycisphaerales bacterium]|nr:23S rRNA (adenine(2503)-C(2))-methyltransferase RlmN [Phycisphaerales bacterium]
MPTLPVQPISVAVPADADARSHVLGMAVPELRALLAQAGADQTYRVDQCLDWLYAKRVESFDQMLNFPRGVRERLAELAVVYRGNIVRESASSDGTKKLLIGWPDGGSVETVWIPDGERHTACVSSQVGCPVGCRFCASGINGVQRNLTTGEIVEQAQLIRRLIGSRGRLSNIVFMGMGEPLANYENVLAAIRILNAPWGLGIGARKFTVSTVGLPKQIRRLAEEDLQLNLALSLHAPDDELRRELIPWDVPIDELLDSCRYYFDRTGREVTFEYVLLHEVNDRPRHADRLAALARRLRANVNLLRYNPVEGLPFQRPTAESAYRFQERLRERGVNSHLRTSRGSDIAAACGQLRRSTTVAAPISPAVAAPISPAVAADPPATDQPG